MRCWLYMKIFIALQSKEFFAEIVSGPELSGIDLSENEINEFIPFTVNILDSIIEFNPNILITDLELPGGDGLKLLKYFKKANPEEIVIILAKSPNPEFKATCLNHGAHIVIDREKELSYLKIVLEKIIKESQN